MTIALAAASESRTPRPYPLQRRAYAWTMILALGAIGLAHVRVSLGAQVLMLLGGMAVIGAPHGVFDIDVALWAAPPGRRGRFFAGFLAGYLFLIGLVAIGWTLAPAVTLVAFLVAAAGHFGWEQGGERPDLSLGERLAVASGRGATVILAPVLLHPAAVTPIFAGLADRPPAILAGLLSESAPGLALAWAGVLAAAGLVLIRRRDAAGGAELASLLALFVLAPPLLAFGVYFCGVHAPRHVLAMARRSGGDRAAQIRWAGARLAPAALGAGLVLGGLMLASRAGLAQAGARTLLWSFEALAALTLPHLLLMPWLEHRASLKLRAPTVPGPRTVPGPCG